MKTAVSLPDDVFSRAERLAKRLRKSRSNLYRDALVEYLGRHEPDGVTEAMNRALDALGPSANEDGFAAEATRQILKRVEW